MLKEDQTKVEATCTEVSDMPNVFYEVKMPGERCDEQQFTAKCGFGRRKYHGVTIGASTNGASGSTKEKGAPIPETAIPFCTATVASASCTRRKTRLVSPTKNAVEIDCATKEGRELSSQTAWESASPSSPSKTE